MNRQQRRAQGKERIEMVDLREVVMPPQMNHDETRMAAVFRLQDNLEATSHPFHHKTANGVIVKPDPTLEYLLSRLPEQEREELRSNWKHRCSPFAPEAVPVNRKYYGFDPFEKQ